MVEETTTVKEIVRSSFFKVTFLITQMEVTVHPWKGHEWMIYQKVSWKKHGLIT